MKKRWISGLLVLLLFLSGCTPVQKPGAPGSIVGEWVEASGLTEYSFAENGTMRLKALDLGTFKGTYEIKDGQLTVSYKIVIKDFHETYRLKLNGDTMYLDDKEYTRRK